MEVISLLSLSSVAPSLTELKPSTKRHPVVAADIATLVPMPHLLSTLGIQVNTRSRRAPCVLHGGTNVTAFSWTEDGRWYCFHCARGGDKLSLIQAVRRSSFLDALRFLAALAGVEWAALNTAEVRQQLAEAKKEAQRVKAASQKLQKLEQDLLLAARDELLSLHKLRRDAGARLAALRRGTRPRFAGEEAVAWDALALVAEQELGVAAKYSLLAFGTEADRACFALLPGERDQMVDETLERGFVQGDTGAVMEISIG